MAGKSNIFTMVCHAALSGHSVTYGSVHKSNKRGGENDEAEITNLSCPLEYDATRSDPRADAGIYPSIPVQRHYPADHDRAGTRDRQFATAYVVHGFAGRARRHLRWAASARRERVTLGQ